MSPNDPTPSPIQLVRSSILVLRGQKILVDADLARFYGVTTSRLNEQVKRNPVTADSSGQRRQQNGVCNGHGQCCRTQKYNQNQ